MTDSRVIIVGAGFAGLGAAVRLLEAGEDDFVVLERAGDVGGTWRDNTYPGCRCDVPSHLYSFSFAPNPDWSETYSPQPEIWAYLRDTAARAGVLPHVRWNSPVLDASWDDADSRWVVTTPGGTHRAQFLILATGALAEPSVPPLPGLDSFGGAVMHSARWDHSWDPAGRRVAVIGTGASAIQIVPSIQPEVAELAVFQRTPAWVVPHSGRPIRDWERRLYRSVPVTQRAVRAGVYLTRELLVLGLVSNPRLLRIAERQARRHLERQVPDPELRARLTPHYSLGCKRILPSNDFYPAMSQPNVRLVTSAITEITPGGLRTADGQEHAVDTIVFGTGFHVTDNPTARLVHGRDGHSLAEAFTPALLAYLGTTIPYFPNLFMMTGPNTGLGHTSMVFMIESQVSYILDALRRLGPDERFEVRPDVARAFNDELQSRLPTTVWGSGCASWYLDERGRNITLWPGFTLAYRRRTRRFDPADYELTAKPVPAPA